MEIPTINVFVPDGPGGSPHTTIQSAVDAAHQSPGGAVWIPASYIGTDSYTNPNSVPIFDMRGAGSVSFASAGGLPGGSTGDMQFNNAGAFANAANIKAGATAVLSSEGNMVMTSPGSFSFESSGSTALLEAAQDVTITSEGATVSVEGNQGVTITADNGLVNIVASNGGLSITSDSVFLSAPEYNFGLSGLQIFANNAAAISGGLAAGDLYRTGANPDVVCVVH